MNHTAEIVELKVYRKRKAEILRASREANAASYDMNSAQTSLMLAVPVVFFVYWPAWFFQPHFASAFSEGGSGAA